MPKEIRARLHLSDEMQAWLEEQAESHHRNVNDEIVNILESAMLAERNREKEMSRIYSFSYEIGSDAKGIVPGELKVEGISEQRAREHAEMVLEDQFPGEEGHSLLELTLQDVQEWER